jgi:hypothetical protein
MYNLLEINECSSLQLTHRPFFAALKEQISLSMAQYVDEQGVRVWSCSVCQKKQKGKVDMERHVATHFSSEQNCNICGKSAKNSEALRTHMKTYHRQDVPKYANY